METFAPGCTVSPQYKTLQTDDRRHPVAKARPIVRSAKKRHQSMLPSQTLSTPASYKVRSRLRKTIYTPTSHQIMTVKPMAACYTLNYNYAVTLITYRGALWWFVGTSTEALIFSLLRWSLCLELSAENSDPPLFQPNFGMFPLE